MANVNGTTLKKMFYNGEQVKKWVHNNKEVYKSELQIVKGGKILVSGYISGNLYTEKYYVAPSTAWVTGNVDTIKFLKTDGFTNARITVKLRARASRSWWTSRTYFNSIGASVETKSNAQDVSQTFTGTVGIASLPTLQMTWGVMNAGNGEQSAHFCEITDITLL